MKTEKERQNARRIEETGYSEKDDKEYEDEYSDDSDDERLKSSDELTEIQK